MKSIYLVVFCLIIHCCIADEPQVNKELLSHEQNTVKPTKNITETTTTSTTFSVYLNEHVDTLKRGFYVFVGVTAIVALYLGVRVYKSRKRKVKSYGLLSSESENVELNPLNSDSDDDYTIFESKPIY